MKIFFYGCSLLLVSTVVLITSCKKDEEKYAASAFVFKHNVNGSELRKGVMNYTNQAGNLYEVDELQYFISEITLKTAAGQIIPITSDSAIHYVDADIPATLTWKPADRIPVTDYDSISFIFGINETKNKTGLFVNPPERDMFWPDMMGGGYHYMKMNGKWMSTGDTVKAFNFHIGIGTTGMGTFYQNYFMVTLPLKFSAGTSINEFAITMNIEKWFAVPNLWDWNSVGGQIMQKQDAMHKACQNGIHVFQVSFTGKD